MPNALVTPRLDRERNILRAGVQKEASELILGIRLLSQIQVIDEDFQLIGVPDGVRNRNYMNGDVHWRQQSQFLEIGINQPEHYIRQIIGLDYRLEVIITRRNREVSREAVVYPHSSS